MVPLGSQAHDFNLKGIDGEMYNLESFKGAKALVIVFMCNHCPYVQKIWADLVNLSNSAPEGVQFVGINSNANPDYPEDSFEKMGEYAAEHNMEFPYLYDETQEVAQTYDAQCTPDFFVYDSEQKLAYRGAFEGLEDAVVALANGEKPAENQQYSMGCSIKFK